jgi:DNA polymerase-3 subunit gamma/tau
VVNLTELWHQLVDSVGRASPFVRGYLIDAFPVSFERGLFVIGFDKEFADQRGLVDTTRNHALLATKLSEFGHPHAQVKFVEAEAPNGWERRAAAPAPAPAPVAKPSAPAKTAPETSAAPAAPVEKKPAPAPVVFNKEEFKNDPLIKKALEVFKGSIVDVRS